MVFFNAFLTVVFIVGTMAAIHNERWDVLPFCLAGLVLNVWIWSFVKVRKK